MGHRAGCTAAALALAWAAAGAQAPPAAFLAAPATRGAFLNGQPLLPGTAILPGETVTTNAGGVLVLTPTAGGGAVELAARTTATVTRTAGGGLELGRGNALVVGPVHLLTPQGERLVPLSTRTSYLVNAAPGATRVGVLAGGLDTLAPGLNPLRRPPLAPGRALEILGGTAGAAPRLRPIALNRVQRPPPNAAMPRVAIVSQSR
jgi:hypothetical protein